MPWTKRYKVVQRPTISPKQQQVPDTSRAAGSKPPTGPSNQYASKHGLACFLHRWPKGSHLCLCHRNLVVPRLALLQHKATCYGATKPQPKSKWRTHIEFNNPYILLPRLQHAAQKWRGTPQIVKVHRLWQVSHKSLPYEFVFYGSMARLICNLAKFSSASDLAAMTVLSKTVSMTHKAAICSFGHQAQQCVYWK